MSDQLEQQQERFTREDMLAFLTIAATQCRAVANMMSEADVAGAARQMYPDREADINSVLRVKAQCVKDAATLRDAADILDRFKDIAIERGEA